ncbi:hypothetical protein D7Y04_39375 [Corallococcus sp. AB038B]|nr:hypothetical protein D7Y04_39375 [Corallococcus sp. AB038B]
MAKPHVTEFHLLRFKLGRLGSARIRREEPSYTSNCVLWLKCLVYATRLVLLVVGVVPPILCLHQDLYKVLACRSPNASCLVAAADHWRMNK